MGEIMLVRQGDVLLRRIGEEAKRYTNKPVPSNGCVVLAYGSATGHTHKIVSRYARLYNTDEGVFLVLSRSAILTHEEHDEIRLRSGTYQVIRQLEWSDEDARRVED
jgi:hypothetical protein